MRSKLGRLSVLVAAVAGLLVSGISPAHAVTEGTATFQGEATTGPLGSPCTPVGTTTDCPPNLTNKTQQPTVGVVVTATTCVGHKLDVKPGSKGIGGSGPLCQIRAQGVVTGYCGLSLGTLTVTVTWFDPLGFLPPKTVNGTVTYKGVGGTLAVTGTVDKGTITAVVQATPNPTQGSCTAGTQTGFIVTGEATLTGTNVV